MNPTRSGDPGPAAAGNALLAIIGGSGLYELPGLTATEWMTVHTPWDAPSDQILTGGAAALRAAA